MARAHKSVGGFAVDSAAEIAEGVLNAAGELVADLVETAGNLVQDALKPGAHADSTQPWFDLLLDRALRWPGSVAAGAANLAGAVIKGASGILAGAVAGAMRLVGGLLTLQVRTMLKGVLDLPSGVGGAAILAAAQLLALIQRLAFLQNSDRVLSHEEYDMLRRVFHDSLALYNIRIIEGRCGVFGLNRHPFVLGNTLYAKSACLAAQPGLLVHECVHVWQYQNIGARYAMDALAALAYYGAGITGGGAYDWQAELARGKSRWRDFNTEAQAAFIQNMWDAGAWNPPAHAQGTGNGVCSPLTMPESLHPGSGATRFIASDGVDCTDFAIESVAGIRSRINLRWSRCFPMYRV